MALGLSLTAFADEPFREHRYDALKANPISQGQIVFAGNSITNMHEWWEAFGSDQRIVNRGTSGGMTHEILNNLDSFIDGKPSKFFLLIGTNDISAGKPYEKVVDNITEIVKRVKAGSPQTEIYVQSILPRVHEPQNTNIKLANELVDSMCKAENVTFINLWDDMYGIRNKGEWSADGLHLYAHGYRTWCKKIAPYLGDNIRCVYDDSYVNYNIGLNNSFGMRVSYFGMLPVDSDDVLIIGDEMIHGGEWHELLRSDHIKNRGIGWGYGGLSLSDYSKMLNPILTGNGNKTAPAKIMFYCGTSDKNISKYSELLDEAKNLAPTAKQYVISLIPLSDGNNDEVVAFNDSLRTLAHSKGATYVDIYSVLLDETGKADSQSIRDNYLYGPGYVKVAGELAKYLETEDVDPITINEFESLYKSRQCVDADSSVKH